MHGPPVDTTKPPLEGLCVLVVEDMPDELRLLGRFLVEAGARVLMAVEGMEALRLAKLMRPDAVVLDVQLPPPDGIAVCRALGEQLESSNIPVLLVSGLTGVQTRLDGFAAGARDFIMKPFTGAELVARVAMHANLGQRLRLNQPDPGTPRWFTNVLQRLQSNLAEPPALEALAQEAGTTMHRLHEAFRVYLNTTPSAFLREVRLKEAARQLRDGSLSVATLGAMLGYPNPANFATAFRERFGMAPRDYRKSPAIQPPGDEALP